jgi:hypothetical protein
VVLQVQVVLVVVRQAHQVRVRVQVLQLLIQEAVLVEATTVVQELVEVV